MGTSSPSAAGAESPGAEQSIVVGSVPQMLAGHSMDLIAQIVAVSRQLFPGEVSYEHSPDPEGGTHDYVIFDVIAWGEYADYRDRILQWHDEVEKIVPNNAGAFRLIVHPHL